MDGYIVRMRADFLRTGVPGALVPRLLGAQV